MKTGGLITMLALFPMVTAAGGGSAVVVEYRDATLVIDGDSMTIEGNVEPAEFQNATLVLDGDPLTIDGTLGSDGPVEFRDATLVMDGGSMTIQGLQISGDR